MHLFFAWIYNSLTMCETHFGGAFLYTTTYLCKIPDAFLPCLLSGGEHRKKGHPNPTWQSCIVLRGIPKTVNAEKEN